MTTTKTLLPSILLVASFASAETIEYEYDELDRLSHVVSGPAEAFYFYDDVGNRTEVVVPEPDGMHSVAAGLLAVALLYRRRGRRRPQRSVSCASALGALALLAPGDAHAQGPPGFGFAGQSSALYIHGSSAPPPTPPSTQAQAVANASQASSSTEITPEIEELARALRYDVDLIFEYVYSQIRYEPMWASNKGALGALLDRSGNDFDQASLMIALLRESGYSARFVYGQLRHPGAELRDWMEGPEEVNAFAFFLAFGGRSLDPAKNTLYAGPGNSVAQADLERVWVKVDIDGTDYVFDPALKSHTRTSGIDVGAAMGYVPAAFVSSALAGATWTPDYIQNLAQANIEASLTGYAGNLVEEIRSNHPGARLSDILGGSSIDPLPSSPRVTSFPNLRATFAEWAGDVPASFRSTLRVRHLGIDESFFSDSLAGRRLTIFYESNRPVMRLDGLTLATGSTVAAGSTQQILLDPLSGFANPIGSPRTVQVEAGGSFLILNGWSKTGSGRVGHHEARERQASFDGGALLSEPVLGESLAVFAAAWLAQTTQICELAGRLAAAYCFYYNSVGVAGQVDNPYLDVLSDIDIATDSNRLADRKKVAFASAGHASALEGGSIEQIQPDESAVSTVALLGIANDTSIRIFDATSGNFSSIEPQLTGYSAAELAGLQSRISSGERLILPQSGSLAAELWSGAGYLALAPSQLGYVISGGLNGGYGTTTFTLDVETNYQPQAVAHKQSFDPIDLVTGDFLLDAVDLSVGSQPFPLGLSFRRSYNSGSRLRDGALGLGWTHDFDLSASLSSDGFQGLGEDSPVDAAAAIVGMFVTLDLLSGGSSFELQSLEDVVIATLIQRWFMTQLTKNTVTVSAPGSTSVFVRLPDGSFNPPPGSAAALSVEPDGSLRLATKHGVELAYDLEGKVESWRDLNGNTVTFSYSGGVLESVSDAANHTLSYSYSGGRIASVSDGTRSVDYGYDSAGNLTSLTDAKGEITRFEYQSDGLLSKVFTPAFPTNPEVCNSYSALGRVDTQLDARGNAYSYYIAPGVRSEEIDPSSGSSVAYYDERGQTVREIDPLGFETLREYDGEERLVYTEAPEGNAWAFEYDERHNRVRETHFPKSGSPLAPLVRDYAYHPVFDRVSSETDPRGNTTDYSYDSRGNLERVEQPQVGGLRPLSTFTYDSRGQVLSSTDPGGTTTTRSYDPSSADLLSTTEDPGGLNLIHSYTYNGVGDRTLSTNPRSNSIAFSFDAMRRVSETRSPAPFEYLSRYSYDPNGNATKTERQMGNPAPWQTTLTTYTASGKVDSVTEPGAPVATTIHDYDARDQLWRVTDAEGRITEFQYDARGNLERVVEASHTARPITAREQSYTPNGELASVRDANGNLTSYRYDGFDRLEFTDFPDQTFEQRAYDPASNVVSRLTRANESILYAYDALDRLVFKAAPGNPSVSFAYDLAGRLVEVADAGGTTTYAYDALGRKQSAVDPSARVVGYEYDPAGNRSRLSYPDGHFITFDYDEMNRLQAVRHPVGIALAAYTYDALSRRTTASYANGTSTAYNYEIDDDLGSVALQFAAGGAPSFSYAYDANHNRTGVEISDPRYVFDLLGLEGTTTYTVDESNQYPTLVEGGSSHSLGYDANGNLLTPPNGWVYDYDAENRLVSASAGSTIVSFEYNAFGLRTKRTEGSTVEYVLDGDQVIAEYDDQGNPLRRYVYTGPDEPILVQKPSTSESWFYHQDALGSVVALTDTSGALAESYAYGPYGRVDPVSTGNGIGNPYRFASREFDPATGLYYHRARDYDPALGRFLQPDPSGYTDGLNLYAYVGGNPINFVDPLGLFRAQNSFGRGRFSQIMEQQSARANRDPAELQDAVETGTGLLALGATALATGMIFIPEPVTTVGGLTIHGVVGATAVGAGALDVGVRAFPVDGAEGSGIGGSIGNLGLSVGGIALPGRMTDALGVVGLAASALSFLPDDSPQSLLRPPLTAKTVRARQRELERRGLVR